MGENTGSSKRKYYIEKKDVLSMNENAELLNFIYQNSQMGVETIQQLMGIVRDEKFKKQLESQFKEYEEIHSTARKMLNENGYDEKGISAMEKIRTYIFSNLFMETASCFLF